VSKINNQYLLTFIAHQSTLWAALGGQDTPIAKNKV